MAATQSAKAIRYYRIYLRDAEDALAQSHDVELASDEDACELVTRMLHKQGTHPCAEVWDRARLVCRVCKEENSPGGSRSAQ
jgi:hypothetical protein